MRDRTKAVMHKALTALCKQTVTRFPPMKCLPEFSQSTPHITKKKTYVYI
uniref:Uncharacterized protein n=1 Tax=Anguilla anguilla TaxID=7936 RepID=A0A0E9S1B3_ANGAN